MTGRQKSEEGGSRRLAGPGRAGQALNRRLAALARWLQARSLALSPGAQKAGVLLFILLFVGWSAVVLYEGVSGWAHPEKVLPAPGPPQTITPLRRPAARDDRGMLRVWSGLDSLFHTERGRRWRDSTLSVRPRLADTLAFLKRYFSHKKTKQ